MKTFSVPQIKLAKKTPYELPTVLVVNKNSDWKKAGFNESEIEYIQAKIQDKKDLITIKSISEMVFLVMEKTEDTLGYKTMEYLRKTGHTIQQQIRQLEKNIKPLWLLLRGWH